MRDWAIGLVIWLPFLVLLLGVAAAYPEVSYLEAGGLYVVLVGGGNAILMLIGWLWDKIPERPSRRTFHDDDTPCGCCYKSWELELVDGELSPKSETT